MIKDIIINRANSHDGMIKDVIINRANNCDAICDEFENGSDV